MNFKLIYHRNTLFKSYSICRECPFTDIYDKWWLSSAANFLSASYLPWPQCQLRWAHGNSAPIMTNTPCLGEQLLWCTVAIFDCASFLSWSSIASKKRNTTDFIGIIHHITNFKSPCKLRIFPKCTNFNGVLNNCEAVKLIKTKNTRSH